MQNIDFTQRDRLWVNQKPPQSALSLHRVCLEDIVHMYLDSAENQSNFSSGVDGEGGVRVYA